MKKKINYFSTIYLLATNENILNDLNIINNFNNNITNLKNELGNNHPEIATLYNLIANFYYRRNDYDNAEKSVYYALDIQKKSLPEIHFDLSYSYNNLHVYCADINEFDLAKQYAYLSFIISLNYPDNYINFANNLNNVGMMYYQIKDYNAAMNYLLKAFYIYSLDKHMYNLSQMSLNNIRNCYIQLNYDLSKFEVWLEEQTRDMTKDKVYAEIEEILNGSDWN